MKYIILMLSMLFFIACSPKYKVVKEYHPPKMTNNSTATIALGVCSTQRVACQSRCQNALKSCQVKSEKIAKQRYAKKMQAYMHTLENYVNQVDDYQFDRSFMQLSYMGYGYPFYRSPYGGYANSLFWYDPMPFYSSSYLPAKPKKPSLKEEQRKAEAEFCDAECDCTEKFDNCYIGSGGKIVLKKLCIENCPQ